VTKSSAWFTHLSWLLVAATGTVYAWMRYLCEPEDPMALANHPLQPFLLASHVLLAPLFVFALGLIWRSHILVKLRIGHRHRRATGYALLSLAIVSSLSGYLLQVATDELLRVIWMWTHAATGLALVLVYVAHQLAPHPSTAKKRE